MGISTHILDTALGRPAVGVPVTLEMSEAGRWALLGEGLTDADGRVKALLPEGHALVAGVYKVRFATEVYYERQQVQGLYPYVEIVFTVRPGQMHYHIPLLLTANGYTTYRGS